MCSAAFVQNFKALISRLSEARPSIFIRRLLRLLIVLFIVSFKSSFAYATFSMCGGSDRPCFQIRMFSSVYI